MNKVERLHIAKVFWSGRSQAVRLPKEFRFDADEVSIRRRGREIVLEPKRLDAPQEDEWAWLDRLPGKFSEEAIAATEADPGEPAQRDAIIPNPK